MARLAESAAIFCAVSYLFFPGRILAISVLHSSPFFVQPNLADPLSESGRAMCQTSANEIGRKRVGDKVSPFSVASL